jgi:hypothetical protein
MLKTAFNRGEICWHRNHGHIVWLDVDDIAYDIGGPFTEYNAGDLLPVEQSLGSMLCAFTHVTNDFQVQNRTFHVWIQSHNKQDYFVVSDIYRSMPKDVVNDALSVEDNAFLYWEMHKEELEKRYS